MKGEGVRGAKVGDRLTDGREPGTLEREYIRDLLRGNEGTKEGTFVMERPFGRHRSQRADGKIRRTTP